MSKFCKSCGAQLKPDVKFCASCGAEAQVAGAQTLAVPSVGAAAKMAANVSFASATAGEIRFAHALPGDLSATIGPLKCILQGLMGLFRGFGSAIKDKKRLIPALILALIWFILTLLPSLGINPTPVRWLSFLTFAGGGTSNGITGLVGGIVGKGVFAYFLFSLVAPSSRGQRPLSGIGSGLKQFFPAIGAKKPAQFALLLLGAGAALVGFNFMAGNVSLQNSMVGIAALLLSIRALSGRAGFLRRFIGALVAKKTAEGKTIDASAINRMIAGMTAGFTLAVLLSAVRFTDFGYILGIPAVLAGITLYIISGRAKEAKS